LSYRISILGRSGDSEMKTEVGFETMTFVVESDDSTSLAIPGY